MLNGEEETCKTGLLIMKNKPSTLVIVESPSKAKTINKYLGKDYIILSSVGHIIDLPKSRLAIDVDNNFKPEYITIRGKAKILNELKKQASNVSLVLLATDPDREGEAISWHLSNALSPKNSNIKRIEFNEITESAIKEAIKHPREIDIDMVNAQQTRRILDRIVGYNISPVLWKRSSGAFLLEGSSPWRSRSFVTVKVKSTVSSPPNTGHWIFPVNLKIKNSSHRFLAIRTKNLKRKTTMRWIAFWKKSVAAN